MAKSKKRRGPPKSRVFYAALQVQYPEIRFQDIECPAGLICKDISGEEWREYDLPGRPEAYRIAHPVALLFRDGGSTHRIIDRSGVAHCVPAPGVFGCVVRWCYPPGTLRAQF